MQSVAIIGGGSAALFLAAELDPSKYRVVIYEKKKTPGRKFLVAGEGGLNLTYDSPVEEFIENYYPREFLAPCLRQFTSRDLRDWLDGIGVPTFTGSSNRVFPLRELKPFEVLNKIVGRATTAGVRIHPEAEWIGWGSGGNLIFRDFVVPRPDVTVFALGGASWKVTGSDGEWRTPFLERGLTVYPFRAANCGFGVKWSKEFLAAHAGKPLKNIAVSFGGHSATGELTISEFGLEGNALYALSQKIQEALLGQATVKIRIDLKPTVSLDRLRKKYRSAPHRDVSAILKGHLKLSRTAVSLLKHCTDKSVYVKPDSLTAAIKSLPVTLHGADELDKAISTLGGLSLDEVDENFRLRKIPDTYAIGEMLDWYAPTGGYLLQACFSMGHLLARHLNQRPVR